MSYELVYTSQQKGVIPGSSGFCIVAHTEGLPANIANVLVSCSGYKALYPAHSEKAYLNPSAYCHYVWHGNGKKYSIISRIGFAGMDYTQRDNKLAHHLVLEHDKELIGYGNSVGAFFESDFFLTEWNQEPHLISHAPIIKDNTFVLPHKIEFWKQLTGTKATAGVIAQIFRDKLKQNIYVIIDEFSNSLNLVYEVLTLLTPEERWTFTFNTFAESVPQSLECFLRFCTSNSNSLVKARMSMNSFIIDLSNKDFNQRVQRINQLCKPYINLECPQNAILDHYEERQNFLFEMPQQIDDIKKKNSIVQDYEKCVTSNATAKIEHDYQQRVKQFTKNIIKKNVKAEEEKQNKTLSHDEFMEELEKTSVPIGEGTSISYQHYQKKFKQWLIWTVLISCFSVLIIALFSTWFIIEFFSKNKSIIKTNNNDKLKLLASSSNLNKNDTIDKNKLKKVITIKNKNEQKKEVSKATVIKEKAKVNKEKIDNESIKIKKIKTEITEKKKITLPPLTEIDIDSLMITLQYCKASFINIPKHMEIMKISLKNKGFISNSLIIDDGVNNKIKIFKDSLATGKKMLASLVLEKEHNKLVGFNDFINKKLYEKFDLYINDEKIDITPFEEIIIENSKFDKSTSKITYFYEFKYLIENLSTNFTLKNVKINDDQMINDNKKFKLFRDKFVLDLKPLIVNNKNVKKHWVKFKAIQAALKNENKNLEVIDSVLDWWKLEKVYDNYINRPRKTFTNTIKKYLKSFYILRQSILKIVDETKITIKFSDKSELNLKPKKIIYKVNFIRKGGINE